ncbi:hypothetical protein CLV37_106142 [Kineococcus rhizosphaerae]|uniref:Uncharacterized protein n=1 Tax=Kineococcus rhizosphaerae TaxID=559628 RepID=A0A2T0R3G3_9ACTN|nr:hypothetical protein CLV37_106142 [Kineococcus rhizosphaerae]
MNPARAETLGAGEPPGSDLTGVTRTGVRVTRTV